MLDKVGRNPVQPFVSCDDFVILSEQPFKQRFLVWIELGFLDPCCNAVVQIRPRNAQFLAPVLVDQLDGRTVLF